MQDRPKRSSGTSITHRTPLRDSLVTSVLGADYATPRAIKIKQPHPRPPGKGSDELILEARRLREQCGMTSSQIRSHLESLGYCVSIDRIGNICNYTTRSHLVPSPGAQPYITTKAAP